MTLMNMYWYIKTMRISGRRAFQRYARFASITPSLELGVAPCSEIGRISYQKQNYLCLGLITRHTSAHELQRQVSVRGITKTHNRV